MRILIILVTLLYSNFLFSKEINLQLEIDWNSIHLADIYWKIIINENDYKIDFLIKSYGLTDKIYNYKSLTLIEGIIEDNQLRPIIYKSSTKSSRQDVFYNIEFSKNGEILNYEISKELSPEQVSLYDQLLDQYQYFTDPISQLVQYFLYNTNSDRLIYDGLNIYKLSNESMADINFENNNPTIHEGITNRMKLFFPFFEGLHKKNKKNNLKEITMYFTKIENINIPVQYDILSKKFNAKLYLKKLEITE